MSLRSPTDDENAVFFVPARVLENEFSIQIALAQT